MDQTLGSREIVYDCSDRSLEDFGELLEALDRWEIPHRVQGRGVAVDRRQRDEVDDVVTIVFGQRPLRVVSLVHDPLPVHVDDHRPTTGYAYASLVFGVLGPLALGIGPIIAVVLGMVARVRITRSGDHFRGRRLANLGIVLGIAWILLGVAAALVVTSS